MPSIQLLLLRDILLGVDVAVILKTLFVCAVV